MARHFPLILLGNFRFWRIRPPDGFPGRPPRASDAWARSEGPVDRDQRRHHPKRHRRSHAAEPKGQQTRGSPAVEADEERGKRGHGQKKRRSHAGKFSAPAPPAAAAGKSHGPFLPKPPRRMRKILPALAAPGLMH